MAPRSLLKSILALGLALSLTGCYRLPDGPPQAQSQALAPPVARPEAPGIPDTLTLAWYPQRPINPLLTEDRANLTLAPLLYQSLFQLDTSFAPQGVLCDGFSADEDFLVWRFHIKSGVTFSDGTPLTAALAASSLELARTSARFASRLSCIASVTAADAHTLTVTLSRPHSALPTLLDIPLVSDGGDRPLGTGPYVLDADAARLIPRVHHQDLPYEIRLIPIDHHTDLTDGFGPEGSLSLVDTDRNATDHPGFSHLYQSFDYDTTALVYLGFNTARSAVRSPQVRTAISQTLDRAALVSAGFGGHALTATLPIHPASQLYDEPLARQLNTPVDPAVQEELLAGRAVTLLVSRENPARLSAAQHIVRQLEKAGMTVTLSVRDWADYLAALSAGQFDLYLGELTLPADFDLSALAGSGGSANYTRWSGAQADRLIAALRTAPQPDRPQAALELCRLLAQQCPFAPLCFKRGSVLVRPELSLALSPTRANVFYGWF